MKIRVVVADDQDLIRAGISKILDAQPDIEVVGEASDGAAAVELARARRPDVVLLDVRMPKMDGIEGARAIAALDPPRCRVIILTTFDLDEYVFDALLAGASGFLLKDTHRDDLIDAVRVVASGDSMLAPSVTRKLIEDFTAHRARAPLAAPATLQVKQLGHLTTRESEILRLMARGLSNAEIAARLSVSDNTVKTHVSNVLSKLGLRDRVQAVVFAYETGLVAPER